MSSLPQLKIKVSGQFHKASKHKNLLSTENFPLGNMGYQLERRAVHIRFGWFAATFCWPVRLAERYFLLNTWVKLGPGPMHNPTDF